MASTPEGKVKTAAAKLYKAFGAKYDRATATGMGRNGRADDIVRRAGDGHFMGVELKKLDVFEVTALQRIWLDDCSAGGGTSMVVNATNLDLLEKVLRTPGYQCVAVFGATEKTRNLCVGHNIYKDGLLVREIPTTGEHAKKF